LASGGYDDTAKIWNIEKNFEAICDLRGHKDTVHSLCFYKAGEEERLISGGADN